MLVRLSQNPLALVALAIAAALLGAGGLWAFDRLAPGSLGDADRVRVEKVVHEYVLDHPEIIPEAMDRLKERANGKIIGDNRDAILKPFGSAWAGNPNGDVTIVEYLDYNCGYCRASLPVIAKLLASDPKLRIVFRDWPILSEESGAAAKMSLAAAEQGKWQAFHDAVYAAGPLSPASIAAAAKAAGVDTTKAAAMEPRAEAELARNMAAARALGMTGTPSWVIGNKVVSAMMPLEDMQKAVAAARAR